MDFEPGTASAKSTRHVGLFCSLLDGRFLCHRNRVCDRMREVMNLLDLVLGVSLAIGLTAYLIYALIRPERF